MPVQSQRRRGKPPADKPAAETGRELVPVRRSQLEDDAAAARPHHLVGFEAGEQLIASAPASVTPLFDEERWTRIREYRLSPLSSPEGGDVA